jgi:hypothetical protein
MTESTVIFALPNLTVQPDNFSIPFPDLAGSTYPGPTGGHHTPAANPDTFLIKLGAR